MASWYTVSDVIGILDNDDFGLFDSEMSAYNGEEVFGYLPEVQQNLLVKEAGHEEGNQSDDSIDDEALHNDYLNLAYMCWIGLLFM